ncbi:MAG: hypothetical protein JHC33_07345 [Ignisphaera sp.]|nr:hypothetical protein [Ignisphaera sp.]
MKTSPSLFQTAAKKYTSFSSDIKDAKKLFLEDLTSTHSATIASAPTGDNPGGTKAPGADLAPLAPGQKSEQPTPAADPGAGMIDLMDPATEVKEFEGKLMAFNKNVPGQALILDDKQAAAWKSLKALAPKNEAVENNTDHTTGDILGPLSALSRGAKGLKETDDMSSDLDGGEITEVSGPVSDTLVSEDEEDGEAPSGTEMEGESEGTAEPATSSSPEMGHPSTMGMSSPSAGLARNNGGATSAGTGDKGNAASFGTDEHSNESSTEKSPGDTTGVSNDYTTEAGKEGKEDTTQTGDTTGKDFAKGAGDAPEKDSGALGPALQNTSVNAGGNNKNASANAEIEGDGITDPNAKEDAFWVPGDDEGFGGLKDVVSTVAKKAGVPDGQTAIVKDPATGALVKRPTMPPQSMPNMRQYVRTNGVPGAPSVLGAGMGHNQVDISDLDGVMGMDTASDRALNISLNFNF